MKVTLLIIVALAVSAGATTASAYSLQNTSGTGPCVQDGSLCNVICRNGQLAGAMYWNGTVWTDGVKSDQDMNEEARKICAANGSDCE